MRALSDIANTLATKKSSTHHAKRNARQNVPHASIGCAIGIQSAETLPGRPPIVDSALSEKEV